MAVTVLRMTTKGRAAFKLTLLNSSVREWTSSIWIVLSGPPERSSQWRDGSHILPQQRVFSVAENDAVDKSQIFGSVMTMIEKVKRSI
jgi:hypothetical protein